MDKYQALFTVEITVSIEIDAENADDAEDQFRSISCENNESILDRGDIKHSHCEWDSTLRPIKKPLAPKAKGREG
jgi:hypothetical protein